MRTNVDQNIKILTNILNSGFYQEQVNDNQLCIKLKEKDETGNSIRDQRRGKCRGLLLKKSTIETEG